MGYSGYSEDSAEDWVVPMAVLNVVVLGILVFLSLMGTRNNYYLRWWRIGGKRIKNMRKMPFFWQTGRAMHPLPTFSYSYTM